MKKIISLFARNYDGDHLVRDEVVPGAEWVIAGEGYAFRKWDGTAALVKDGRLYKRYDAKKGKQAPEGFEPAQDPDPVTGHWPGWLPIGEGKEDKWFREAFQNGSFEDGTYELCGPKVNGNPEVKWSVLLEEHHLLIPHVPQHVGMTMCEKEIADAPRTYDGLKDWFKDRDIEGIVWHHEDKIRMVKIKKKDFGYKR